MSRNQTKQYSTFRQLAPTEEKKSSYMCMEVQDHQHRKKIIDENSVVCVYLRGDWCEPCKSVAPVFYNLAERYNNPGRCALVKESVDLGLTKDCQVTGIPAFIFYKNRLLVRNNNKQPVMVVGGDIKQVEKILDQLLGTG